MVEIVLLMLILKIPILYLVGVCWWAVRAEPRPEEPATLVPAPENQQPPSPPDRTPRRPSRGGPHGHGRASRRAERMHAR